MGFFSAFSTVLKVFSKIAGYFIIKKSVERDIMKDQLDDIHTAKTIKDNLNRDSIKRTRNKLRDKFIRK
tara:strand:- start:7769 stop:7975 length:207 start_codon:yes stop_codon:yes gene_type:complete